MNTSAVATYRAAATSYWKLASSYRQIGKFSLSRHYAVLAQVYHANAAEAEDAPEPVRRSWVQRLLGVRA